MSFAAEFIADSSGKYCGNTLRFETEAEAQVYAEGLMQRWTSCRSFRIVPSEDEVTAAVIECKLEFVKVEKSPPPMTEAELKERKNILEALDLAAYASAGALAGLMDRGIVNDDCSVECVKHFRQALAAYERVNAINKMKEGK
jgi:hypothetical protein